MRHVITFLRFEITNTPVEKFPPRHFVEKADDVSAMIKKQHLATLLCLLVSGFAVVLAPVLAQQPSYPFNDPSLPIEKRVDNLFSLMTIDEKVNCLSTN